MTFFGFTDHQLFAAAFALAAAYFVYANVLKRTGSRKEAFWWGFAVAALPGLGLPAYLIYWLYLYFKGRKK